MMLRVFTCRTLDLGQKKCGLQSHGGLEPRKSRRAQTMGREKRRDWAVCLASQAEKIRARAHGADFQRSTQSEQPAKIHHHTAQKLPPKTHPPA